MEVLDEVRGNYRLYSMRSLLLATFIGTPLAAGYLYRENCKELGMIQQGNIALIYAIIFTIIILTGLFTLPDEIIETILNQLIPLVSIGFVYAYVQANQQSILENHKEEGRDFYSGWKAAGISLLFLLGLIMVGTIAIFGFA